MSRRIRTTCPERSDPHRRCERQNRVKHGCERMHKLHERMWGVTRTFHDRVFREETSHPRSARGEGHEVGFPMDENAKQSGVRGETCVFGCLRCFLHDLRSRTLLLGNTIAALVSLCEGTLSGTSGGVSVRATSQSNLHSTLKLCQSMLFHIKVPDDPMRIPLHGKAFQHRNWGDGIGPPQCCINAKPSASRH
ncbi:hypothetical protein PHSY_003418 [Pseudozyma hubeiensis SY62]|uniref:Uncharacterized protein n=1 Tax=Pseudozyma hubeiensis (strain SY62) TaxID=1305764 RepID=R9P3D1_PSEHS|nr:hypothetical protein PHSY_003418 [Pseudozyma hubeiensis SY62]GAC95841.1 hypothetical protein PHSY_003418 [Pseudozyma hubeiensis SY62]